MKLDKPWENCPPGRLQALSRDLRAVSRRRLLKQASGGAAAAALVGVGVWKALGDGQTPAEGQLNCRQAQPHLAAYLTGRLSPPLDDQVRAHLKRCRICQEKLKQLQA